ncbi:MAG: radical SAM protein [Pseudomonadota bacterium]
MESPEYVRLSLAAAMTLGFTPGLFYRDAQLRCINLLLTYESGCLANCSFCGLARDKKKRHGDKDFIRVAWKTFETAEVLARLARPPAHVERVCISMITHPKSKNDAIALTRDIRRETALPTSLLITPTLLDRRDLEAMKAAGADRVGVAIDCATPELFDRLRGAQVRGPHRWDHYWRIYEETVDVFGRDMTGVHLIVGLGETEEEMVEVMDRARRRGGTTHLFSFFPEKGSDLEDHPQPPLGQYRRIQAARFLIDADQTEKARMKFDARGRITDFGLPDEELSRLLSNGVAFETSGCPGASGRTACNRPYGNERPGPNIRNFPFTLEPDDLAKVFRELRQYEA